MKIQPLNDKVLVEPLKVEEKVGGLFIPEKAKESSQRGKIISIGRGKLNEKGEIIPSNLKIGDIILFPKYGGIEIKIDNTEYKIFSEEEILCVIEE